MSLSANAVTRPASAEPSGSALPLLMSISAHAAILALCLAGLAARRPDPAPLAIELHFAPPNPIAAAGRPIPAEAALPDLANAAESPPTDASLPEVIRSMPPPEATPPLLPDMLPLATPGVAELPLPAEAASAAPVPPLSRPLVRPARPVPARPLHRLVSRPARPDQAASTEAAPIAPEAPAASNAVAPRGPVAQAIPAAPSPGWRAALAAWLAAHKQYPDEARRNGQEGAVGVSFLVARDGRVERVMIEHSSGVPSLDRSVYAMLEDRTVPPFPDSMPQDHMDVRVTIRFEIER